MREWNLTPADPMAPRIAADARNRRTNTGDDQVWALRLGGPTEPAAALETRFGGRVGLARLVPIWLVNRRQVYETSGYHRPPTLNAFAPDYLRLKADITLNLHLTAEYWTMKSQAVGGRFLLFSDASTTQTVRLDLSAQAVRDEKNVQMFYLTLENAQVALQMGRMSGLEPVLLLENAAQTGTSARLSRTITVEPGQTAFIRWVLAGLPRRDDSLALAYRWLADPNWESHLALIKSRAEATPDIETGHADWDAALAWSQQIVLRSFLAATTNLPHPSFVLARKPSLGFSTSGVQSGGFHTPWGGQTIPDALHIAPAVALSAPDLAEGLVRNFLAVQRDDGWIDARPGLDGQRVNVIAPPLLAVLAYTVYHYTGNKAFLAEMLDRLAAFFYRWFKPDLDRDRDGLPEWPHPDSGAFTEGPTLAQNRRGALGLDVTTVETPDLAAYLVREAETLIRIAKLVDRPDMVEELTPRYEALKGKLGELWDAERGLFHYRDRDTHGWPSGELIFEGKGDQALTTRTTLPAPGRLVLRVIGGLSRKPNVTCTIEGIRADGKSANETLTANSFNWYRSAGVATTSTTWSTIASLKFNGLSRVYTVQVNVVDLSRHDASLLLPLWSGSLDDAQIERTTAQITDDARYWREYGIPACPATDPAYDPTAQNGCGGAWPKINALIAWGLLNSGCREEALDLFGRVLAAQIRTLTEEKTFRSFINAETGEGLGESDAVFGAVSMGWFARLFGGYVLGPDQVMITGPFAFNGETMTWKQHGVTVRRSDKGTEIIFPSGHKKSLKPDARPELIRDTTAKPKPRPVAPPVQVAPPGPRAVTCAARTY